MKTCENCGTEHIGNYGSGRFCSSKCSRGFSTKAKRSEINAKVSLAMSQNGNKLIEKECKKCKKMFYVRWTKREQTYCSRSCAASFNNEKNLIKLRESAIRTGLGGNRNRSAHGWYESSIAGRVFLESSWEFEVAKELDDKQINWCRPKFLSWEEDGTVRKYYPDFYLTDFDIYLDPKNSYLQITDKNKIEKVMEQNHVKIVILSKNELSWEKIKEKLPL
jgi:hypothetical protein